MTTAARPRCTAHRATGVDGFAARDDGSIDGLEAAQRTVPADEDCGCAAFVAGIGALVVGRPWGFGFVRTTWERVR